jgi:hypothetical protein
MGANGARDEGNGMKGQYFSFDAVIATVIMVLAFSSLVTYWSGAQKVVEDRTNSRLADAGRVAEMLLTPGSPANWQGGGISAIRQIGIATEFGNEIDLGKADALKALADSNYRNVGNLLRTGGDYYILIESIDGTFLREIGKPYYSSNATAIAVANRGGTYIDAFGNSKAARLRVFLYR